jgi:6-phosphogluconolactonase
MGMRFGFCAFLLAVFLCGLTSCTTRKVTTATGTGFLYYTTQGDSSLWSYSIALASGSLTPIGTTQSTGSMPFAIAITPSLNALFVDNEASNSVSAYSIHSDGSVTAASGSSATGSMPMGMAIDPAGKFLFVANQGSSNVSVFSINTTTLTEVAGSPFTTIPAGTTAATGPAGVVVSATGNFLYVSNNFAGTLSAFSVNSSGALTPLGTSPYTVGTAPSGVGIIPSGAFLYVANSGSNNVSAFAICDKVVTTCSNPNSPDGTLTPVPGSPFSAGQGPVAIAADPAFHFLYVVDKQSNQISGYAFATGTGVLTALSSPAVSTGVTPTSLVVISGTTGTNVGNTTTNPTDYVYVTNNGSSTLSGSSLSTTTGILTPLSQAVTTTANPSAVAAN